MRQFFLKKFVINYFLPFFFDKKNLVKFKKDYDTNPQKSTEDSPR